MTPSVSQEIEVQYRSTVQINPILIKKIWLPCYLSKTMYELLTIIISSFSETDKLGDFIQFLTGRQSLPPLGLRVPPSVQFRHPEDVPREDPTRDLPLVCACFHVLKLPTGHKTSLQLLQVLTNTVSICKDFFTNT